MLIICRTRIKAVSIQTKHGVFAQRNSENDREDGMRTAEKS
jgi:hypothetical protein